MGTFLSFSNPPLLKYVEMPLQVFLYQLNACDHLNFYMVHISGFYIMNSLSQYLKTSHLHSK